MNKLIIVIVIVMLIVLIVILIGLYFSSSSSYKKEIEDLNNIIYTTNSLIAQEKSNAKLTADVTADMKKELNTVISDKDKCDLSLEKSKNDAREYENELKKSESELNNLKNTSLLESTKIEKELNDTKIKMKTLTKTKAECDVSLMKHKSKVGNLNSKHIELYNEEVFKIYDLDVQKNTKQNLENIINNINGDLGRMQNMFSSAPNFSTKELLKKSIKEKVIVSILRNINRTQNRIKEFSYITDCFIDFIKDDKNHEKYIDFITDILFMIKTNEKFRIQLHEIDTIESIIKEMSNIRACIPLKSIIYYSIGTIAHKRNRWILYPIACTIGKKTLHELLNNIIKLEMFKHFPNINKTREQLINDIDFICLCSSKQAYENPFSERNAYATPATPATPTTPAISVTALSARVKNRR